MLKPNPPKESLAIPMATKLPTIIIQMGRVAGILKANKIPVIKAEPSHMVTSVFMMNFWIKYSNNKQEITATEVAISAFIPNTYNDTKKAGTKAITTSYMIFFAVLSECTCGEAETTIGGLSMLNSLRCSTF